MQGIKKLEEDILSLEKTLLDLFGQKAKNLIGLVENSDHSDYETAVNKTFESLWPKFRYKLVEFVKNELAVNAEHYKRLMDCPDKNWEAYARMRTRVAFTTQYPLGRDITTALTPKGRQTEEVTINPSVQVLPVGSRVTFSAAARDRVGKKIDACQFHWNSTTPTVAPVDAMGVVYTIAAGNTEIKAVETVTKRSGTARVTVI